MKLSIVITHHNRRRQLINTLLSMAPWVKDRNIEIIIVDDVSQQKITDIPKLFPYNIKLIERIAKEPDDLATAHNIGFSAVRGDVILINNGECLHAGDIIGDIFSNFTDKDYIAYSTYSIDTELYAKVCDKSNIFDIVDIIQPMHPLPKEWKDMDTGWYSHPQHNYSLMPFCAAISTSSMDVLQGYDERFNGRTGWIDHDFVHRVKNLGLDWQLKDRPFCVHQPHDPTDYSGKLNNEFFLRLQQAEPHRITCHSNKNYRRQ